MTELSDQDAMVEKVWRTYLMSGETEEERRQRYIFKLLPGNPRCKYCYAPFRGIGGSFARIFYGKLPSKLNPHLCNICDTFASKYQGGAEVELSLLFADVRGSTKLAESMSPIQFSKLINRFYNTSARILVNTDGLIDKIIGDQVAAIYVPGIAGKAHARHALDAAREILLATGHSREEGPWIPLGVGVHTGSAFVGSVGSEDGSTDITVLGDAANTAARLASSARQGEILISDTAYQELDMDLGSLEQRQLELKGKSQPVMVHVLTKY